MLRTKNAIGLFVVSLTLLEKIQERAMIGNVSWIFSKTVIDLQSWLFLEFSRERLMIRRKVRWHFLSATSRSTRKFSFPYLASFRREKENCSKNSDFHPFFEICEICRGSIFENESVMDSSWPRLWYGDVRDAGRPLRFRDNRRVRFPIVTIFAPAR